MGCSAAEAEPTPTETVTETPEPEIETVTETPEPEVVTETEEVEVVPEACTDAITTSVETFFIYSEVTQRAAEHLEALQNEDWARFNEVTTEVERLSIELEESSTDYGNYVADCEDETGEDIVGDDLDGL